MKESDDKILDGLTKKLISERGLETPSMNFTNDVMSRVNALSTSNSMAYRPLISKPVWLIIGIVFSLTLIYILSLSGGSASSWFDTLEFDVLPTEKLTAIFSGINMSQTLAYTIGIFAIMICVQVTYLKHHFNKRFEV